jgi:riboflavin biosynthesis pyrimidine reductase
MIEKLLRPKIICHMMASIDGKITYGKINGQEITTSVFADYLPDYITTEAKYKPKAYLCGRATMEMFAEKIVNNLAAFKDQPNSDVDYINKNPAGKYFFGIDTKGVLRWENNFVMVKYGEKQLDKKFSLVIIVTKTTPKKYLNYLKSKKISYIFAGETTVDFKILFNKFKRVLQIEQLLLDGGGITNGTVISDQLIDEISLLIIPMVINNIDAPAVFDKKVDFQELYNFKLLSVKKYTNGVVWLRYQSNFT